MKAFLRGESASGFVLIAAAVAGVIWANSPFAHQYDDLLHAKIGIVSDAYSIHLTLHEWVDDALMAVFFLLVGLEIKYEFLAGALSSPARVVLPALAALGGMALPALICTAFVVRDPAALRGWAVPAATDIAFALAALSLCGATVSARLKVFLTTLAVIDDLGAIVIIAFFYTDDFAWPPLLAAGICLAVLLGFNRFRVQALPLYVAVGVVMWACVFESGVHATLAGVALAFTIPISAVKRFEHGLKPYVGFAIMPLFGLFNAGISFAEVTPAMLVSPLALGVTFGLFAGKQLGIFACSWLAVRFGAPRPAGTTWAMLYGAGLLGGIGFTMSLFIGALAFDSEVLLTETKVGVFAGSILSAVAAFVVLRRAERAALTAAPKESRSYAS